MRKAAARQRHRAESLTGDTGVGLAVAPKVGLPASPFTPGLSRCHREGLSGKDTSGAVGRGDLSLVLVASSVSQPPMGEHSPSLGEGPW